MACAILTAFLIMFRTSHQFANRFLSAFLLVVALSCQARIGVEYQMPLGDPSNATSNPNNHEHYLIQRSVFAMDYDDRNGEPNWVSWDLTAEDIGPAKRTPVFHADAELPASFHHITSADYTRSGFDRGHMCPSADRTDNQADNNLVFAMSNIIPQTKDNNEGVWEHLESYCREQAQSGNELLIICGPASFSGQHINQNGPVLVPAHTWKIVVEVPNGSGSVLSRITTATRVIAVDIPNIAGVRNDPWTKYQVSVNQLEALTGFKFFTALSPDIAKILKAKNDGQSSSVFASTEITSSASSQQLNWVPVALTIVIFLLILCIIVVVLFLKARPRR
jgi:DNA/RNA endonuclease G (NUC1)